MKILDYVMKALDFIIELIFLEADFLHVQIPMPQIIIDITVSVVRFVVNVYLALVGFGFLVAFLVGVGYFLRILIAIMLNDF